MSTSAFGAHWLVAPPLDGPVTGGTLYNRELLHALARAGVHAAALELEEGARSLASGVPGHYWIDTLYLSEFKRLFSVNASRNALGMLTHYLPSLVRDPEARGAALGVEERFALEHALALVAPSRFLAEILARHSGAPIAGAEPGRGARGRATQGPAPGARLALTLVANLVPGKGVAGFLSALAPLVAADDDFTLAVVGSTTLDAACAARCRAAVDGAARLAGRVHFDGALAPETVLSRLEASDLVISASHMESYGMVLAEARTLGIPIVARSAGNTPALVDPASGGELVGNDAELAAACLRLVRDRAELARRRAAAERDALPPRPWSRAAEELIDFVRRGANPVAGDDTRRETSSRTTR